MKNSTFSNWLFKQRLKNSDLWVLKSRDEIMHSCVGGHPHD